MFFIVDVFERGENTAFLISKSHLKKIVKYMKTSVTFIFMVTYKLETK